MSLLLNIDTAETNASICVSENGKSLQLVTNNNQQDHATWIHSAIEGLMRDLQVTAKDINAIAISIGPGSYTGLRVGLSTAKGLCFAWGIPLITINTLEVIAFASNKPGADLLCPLIDARRMEVFTATYNRALQLINIPRALIIDENSFAEILASHKIIFSGSGSKKLQAIVKNTNAIFSYDSGSALHLAMLAQQRFQHNQFADLAYTEPLYIKEFYAPSASHRTESPSKKN